MKKFLLISLFVFILPTASFAGGWSEYIQVTEVDGIQVSYHVREQKNGWFVEWKGENVGSEWGEAVSASRTYTCEDGTQQKVTKNGTFGPLPPGENRKMIRDMGVCSDTSITTADIEIVVQPVHENVKKMYY